ncbi:unnamed protein product [Lepeophtheirus salmonis]|uniref:(salmon louse) hypothetical protein n=1 Tax=Lepeophtheirus salmonis TaxID=72036 RepID=A0A7R8CJB7_LEPSM|nr:unnamed protein product [Lepeophtheirus salmonis]CAF2840753.1 unnamed protein product [Lepeophtheirus salmonis]
MAFGDSTYTLNNPGNGNFWKEVELSVKFDPLMKHHVSRIESGAGSHVIYLAKRIQNDLIESISSKILKELNISFEDFRSQFYDNGANMNGRKKGVQVKFLHLTSKAFFITFGATLNLVVADPEKSLSDALNYFGHLIKLFKLFSASSHRWDVLLKHTRTTLKLWAESRWHSRIKSIKVVRYQDEQVKEAILEVTKTAADPVVRVEAQSLGTWILSLFLTHAAWCCCRLAEENQMFPYQLQKTGFAASQISAQQICEEMNVEAELKQKLLRTTKRHFWL